MPDMSDADRLLREVYKPALEEQIKQIDWLGPPITRTPLTRRIKFRYWRKRVVSNIKDAWHVLWHGPDKFMDW